MLETVAALENLMVGVYTSPGIQALVVGARSSLLVTLFARTVEQHLDHARAVNQLATTLGGRAQSRIDAVLDREVVAPVLMRRPDLGSLLELAARLEDVAAQTQVRFAADAGDSRMRAALATISPVEAQHLAVLRLVRRLLDAGVPPAAIELPLRLDPLPAAAGAWGFAASREPLDAARPRGEGATGG